MRKITLILCAVLLSFMGYSQGHETFDGLGTGTSNSYHNGSFTGQDGSTWNYLQSRNDEEAQIQAGNPAIMLGRNRTPNSELESGTLHNGIGTLEFTYMQAFSSNVNLEVYVNDILVHTATSDGEQGVAKNSGVINVNVEGNFTLKFYNPSGAGQVNIDDIIWTAMGNDPTIYITSPANNAEIPPYETPVLSFNVANFNISSSTTAGDGDGYIVVEVDGQASNHFNANPIELTGLGAGAHTAKVSLVDNNGNNLNPEVSDQVAFTITEYEQVASIAALRAGDQGNYYHLSSEAILTFQQSFRNQKYIQDQTGAILIDDNAGVITQTYSRNDGITGIKGKLTINNGILQFQPIEDTQAATSSDNRISPVILDIATFNANPNAFESQIIAFENVTFVDGDGTNTFGTGQNYIVTDGTNEVIMRTNFYDADYIGELIPQGQQEALVGVAAHFQGDGQFFIRDSRDLDGSSLSVDRFSTFDVTMYPNPARDNVQLVVEGNAQVEIYSILGKRVAQFEMNNQATVSVADFAAGIYVVKIAQDGKQTTRKLIVK